MMQENQKFDPVSRDEWMERIRKDLKGTSLEEMRLNLGGIDFPRYVHIEDQAIPPPEAIHASQAAENWTITSHIRVTDVKKANAIILEELAGGTQSLRIQMDSFSAEDTDQLMTGIIPEYIQIHWNIGPSVAKAEFMKWWENWQSQHPPVAHSVTEQDKEVYYDELSGTVTASGHQNLARPEKSAKAMVHLLENIHSKINDLLEKGADSDKIKVRCLIPAGSSILWEISKLRAVRILLSHLALAFQMKIEQFSIEASSSQDVIALPANDHKIATPVVALACIAGNADAICLPIAETIENTKESFHRRIARNVHHLMLHESRLGKVFDPAAGSYFFEKLTDSIARNTWELLQEKLEEQ